MASLSVNLFRHPSGKAFCPQECLRLVKQFFPNAEIDERDQLAIQLERAHELVGDEEPAAKRVLDALRLDYETGGPAYMFRVRRPDGSDLLGVVKRQLAMVRSDTAMAPAVRDQVRAFLTALLPGDVGPDIIKERLEPLEKESPITPFAHPLSPMPKVAGRMSTGVDIASDIYKNVQAIRGPSPKARRQAEMELIEIGAPAIPGLLELLRDKSWVSRLYAVRVIARIGRPLSEERTALEQLLQTETDEYVRCNATWALSEITARGGS